MDARYEDVDRRMVELGDFLLCPSDWVADSVAACYSDMKHKIRIVPYGSSIDYNGRCNEPIIGRFFFAGEDWFRKGLHYVAMAVNELIEKGLSIDMRVAGNISENVRAHPLFRNIHFLGKLDATRMQEEFLSAQAFILPSLSEGFAGVIAEALTAGCPIICTNESGSPVKNKREGLLVKTCSFEELIFAIQYFVDNPDFQRECSKFALETAESLTFSAWKKRLSDVISEIENIRL